MIAKLLLIGCGDIAVRLANRLAPKGFECHGLRRHPEQMPPYIQPIAWDLDRSDGLAEQIAGFDVVVITLVPGSRDATGYRKAYVENMEKIVTALESRPGKPPLVFFVSSTSVYGQSNGEWIDESSPTAPTNFRGRAVLEGEERLRHSSLDHCIVRFSGIYGPGRDRLIRQVRNGETGERDSDFSNRIHAEDCAAVLAHLIHKKRRGETLDEIYLASDCEPVQLAEVKRWLAERIGLPGDPWPTVSGDAGGKRVSNRRLLASGYGFVFPTFREGYGNLFGLVP